MAAAVRPRPSSPDLRKPGPSEWSQVSLIGSACRPSCLSTCRPCRCRPCRPRRGCASSRRVSASRARCHFRGPRGSGRPLSESLTPSHTLPSEPPLSLSASRGALQRVPLVARGPRQRRTKARPARSKPGTARRMVRNGRREPAYSPAETADGGRRDAFGCGTVLRSVAPRASSVRRRQPAGHVGSFRGPSQV
jgi:hypothetical protein